MKRITLIGTIAAGALVASLGVGAAIAVGQDPSPQPTSTVPATSPSGDQTSEPVSAESPDPETIESRDNDDAFVAYVRGELLWDTGIANATDAQLIQAAHEACRLLRDGVDSESIRLIEGEKVAASGYFMDTLFIIDGARRYYCPETIF